jgi:hypothetical protein
MIRRIITALSILALAVVLATGLMIGFGMITQYDDTTTMMEGGL